MSTIIETKPAAEKKAKASKTKSENAAVKPKAEMIKISATSVAVQLRTSMLFARHGRPDWFFLEPAKPRREADKGNEKNQIERGVHQVDPNRAVSCCCVMPSMKLLHETGNPYPKTGEGDASIVTNPRWLKFVPLMNAIWNVLKSASGPMTGSELATDAIAMAKIGKEEKVLADAGEVIRDCLRDLRLFGLATSDEATALLKKTKFEAVMNPKAVAYTPAVE